MGAVEGDKLARLLARATSRGERVTGAIVVRIAQDALAGLHAAHEQTDEHGALIGVVHRDVSLITCSSASTARRGSRTSASRARRRKCRARASAS